jgi:hypothetical protein
MTLGMTRKRLLSFPTLNVSEMAIYSVLTGNLLIRVAVGLNEKVKRWHSHRFSDMQADLREKRWTMHSGLQEYQNTEPEELIVEDHINDVSPFNLMSSITDADLFEDDSSVIASEGSK